MTVWLDNNLSPKLARWIEETFEQPCVQIREVGLERASDTDVFRSARSKAKVLITKDRDFIELVFRLGPPPGVILLNCGNTSTAFVQTHLKAQLGQAIQLIFDGEQLVEISG